MDIDLSGCQTNARSVVHGFEHILDQIRHAAVDIGHWGRNFA